MEWLVPNKLMVAYVQPFEELEEYAMKAIEAKELGDEALCINQERVCYGSASSL